jgi:hypothetical protein
MSLDCKMRRLVVVAAHVASLASHSPLARAQPPSGASASTPASTARMLRGEAVEPGFNLSAHGEARVSLCGASSA